MQWENYTIRYQYALDYMLNFSITFLILVLPKFELDVKPPAFFAFDQREIPVSICAR